MLPYSFDVKRSGNLAFAILTISFGFSVFATGEACAQSTDATIKLEIGKTVERRIAGGQNEAFRLDLAAGQYASIEVEQQGVDVRIRLADPTGKELIVFDDDPRPTGTETVEIAARASSVISLIVEPSRRTAASGHFEIILKELRAATEADLDLDDARRDMFQATELWRAGKLDEALPIAQKAADICGRQLGHESFEYGHALFVLANIYGDNGDLDKSVDLYKESIRIKEKIDGKDSLSTTSLLNNYATVLKDKGDYPAAQEILQRVVDIRRKGLEPDHPLIPSALINLANVYRSTGNVTKAAALFDEALKIRERILPPNHPDIALVLNNIANLYDDVERSEPYLKRALAIREEAFGPDSQEVAQTVYNFAVLYADNGDYAKAEPMCRRSLAIYEAKAGKDHYLTSYPMNLLAALDKEAGRFDEAEALYKRAIAIKEKSQGPFHPDLAGALTNLANLYTVMGQPEKAVETQQRANEIYEFNTSLNLSVGSEREKLAYLATLNFIQDQTLSLNLRAADHNQKAIDLGLTSLLRRKGRVLDAMSDGMKAVRGRLDSGGQAIMTKLGDATTKLASLVIEGPPSGNLDEYRRQLDGLVAERENIENQISKLGAGYFPINRPVNLDAVKSVLPEDAVLIEFALYHPISPKAFEFASARSDERSKSPAGRYVAYILHHTGDAKWVDLGDAGPIDKSIAELRNALRDSKSPGVEAVSRRLGARIIAPLRSAIGPTKHLLISSEGELNLIPFEALVDEKGRYLVEDFLITYLTSGRDLLRMGTTKETAGRPLILANPAYGTVSATQIARLETSGPKGTGRVKGQRSRGITDTYFAPLGGTAQEAEAIQKLYPESTLLEGTDATKASLKKASAPRLLHIATHGFFLTNDEMAPGPGYRGVKPGWKSAPPNVENPLVRSGLALAGANRRTANNNDGILSALEASGLDLWGTKLVVLSACDTGVGEVRSDEGVYGLRRSFMEAGAESLVMSLWPVSDSVTRELMTNYYKNLKQGLGRGESLRDVQLGMLRNPARRHPFYWASFIQSGDWRPLSESR
ncbi:MAG: CHAT domain-containing tetratricopeptide repeat protein [Acidobacteriota bacterium]